MKLSNDLTLIESKNKEDVKLYNSFTNTLTELNSEIYDYLIKCKLLCLFIYRFSIVN